MPKNWANRLVLGTNMANVGNDVDKVRTRLLSKWAEMGPSVSSDDLFTAINALKRLRLIEAALCGCECCAYVSFVLKQEDPGVDVEGAPDPVGKKA